MASDAVRHLIGERYRIVHGAMPKLAYSDFATRNAGEKLSAALGYRRAHQGRLFLEAYLDQPVEMALADVMGRHFDRGDIIEIGNLASDNALAMIALWADAANDLGGDAEIAVAVLTAPLRSMFRRLNVKIHEIVPARAERLGEAASEWGSYYRLDPVVCAGFIAEGQERLARLVRSPKVAA